MTQKTETTHCRDTACVAFHGGVAASSIALGYAMMRLFVLPNVPNSDIWALTVRFFAYALLLAVVYRCSDVVTDCSPIRFAPFSGLTAAAFAAAPYLLVFGVPTSLFLVVVVSFRLGGAFGPCWCATPGKERAMEMGRQLVRFSRTLLVLAALMLSGIFVASIASTAAVSESLF